MPAAVSEFLEYLTSGRVLAIVLGIGFALLAITLFIASRTKWGQTKPLTKCVVLSVLAHIWLLMYALGHRPVLPQGQPDGQDQQVAVHFEDAVQPSPSHGAGGNASESLGLPPSLLEGPDSQEQVSETVLASDEGQSKIASKPWERVPELSQLPLPEVLSKAFKADSLPTPNLQAPSLLASPEPTPLPDLPPPETRADDSTSQPADEQGSQPQSLPEVVVEASQRSEQDRSQDRLDTSADLQSPVLPPVTPPLMAVQSERGQALIEQDVAPNSMDSRAAPVNPQQSAMDTRAMPAERPDAARQASAPAVLPDASTRKFSGGVDRQATVRAASRGSPILPPAIQTPVQSNVPPEYRLRQAENRLQIAAAYGADEDTEAAVSAGLRWLASAQTAGNSSQAGGWNARRFGAGTETRALGEYRYGTGEKADTGISGLALLAFLSAGHTHLAGEHQRVVKRGLEYLLRAQMPSGDLSGPKQVGHAPAVMNARMYCHGIATLALAEAYAMTRDPALVEAVTRAAQYTINAQDPRGGGWRYRPGDPGDLSQFGWQAMGLRSVERSGISLPPEVKRRMRTFLDACSAGNSGGLARYQPHQGRPSATMTAEALACRLLLDHPLSLAGRQEAIQMIMSQRPGVGEANSYLWYYATLALFQLQDENWRVWNQALKQELLATQLSRSPHAGSWDPDQLWGGYGGRVYATAMNCLCLEVYYRYLPMYQVANVANRASRSSRR